MPQHPYLFNTTIAENIDAEDVMLLINQVWLHLDQIVLEHGGVIDKHIGDAVMAVYQDSKDNIWIGTGGGGFNKYDPQTGTFIQFRESDGLANDFVYGILEDRAGFLWLSTNRGLSRFDPGTETFRNYTSHDGLQSDEFNQGAYLLTQDGRIIFGGVNGINIFDPLNIQENPYLPPVVITQFSLFNETVGVGENSILPKSLQDTESITLDYRDDFIAFEFASLHYSAPEQIQYAYMLEGFDEDWVQAGNRHYAGYTNVPPGDYTFRVRATNSDGVWNMTGTALEIKITPPFWQTLWFRSLGIAGVLSAIVATVEIRLRIVRAQKRQLEILVDERTQELRQAMSDLESAKEAAEAANRAKSTFLANVSHELRTPLNAILGFSQLMIRSAKSARSDQQKLSPEQFENIEIINASGEHLLGLINEVLEMSKIEAGRTMLHEQGFDLHHLLEGLEDMFRLRAEEKGLTLEFDIREDVSQYIRLDEGKLRQILMNLLGNAVKFTQEGGVLLRVSKTPQGGSGKRHWLKFEVEDSGSGIRPDELEGIFKPFTQAANADLVITTGGISVGEEDHVRPAVEAEGQIDMWKIAIKPGKPLAFGEVRRSADNSGGKAWFIGLPGNPVSAMVTFMIMVRPFVLRLQGVSDVTPRTFDLRADFDWPRPDVRAEFLRGRINEQGGVELFPNQGSGVVTSLCWGDGLVVNPPAHAFKRGDSVRFVPFAELLS